MRSKFQFLKNKKVYLIFILVAILILHTVAIVATGFTDEYRKSDVILVFGTRINTDGQPSNLLKMRLDNAIKLKNQGLADKIIVSGAKADEGFDEAVVMKEYLIENGISEENIWQDSQGYDTYHTCKNASIITHENGFNSILLSTDYYHVLRAKRTCKKFGIKEINAVHADYLYYKDVFAIVREIGAIYSYELKDY